MFFLTVLTPLYLILSFNYNLKIFLMKFDARQGLKKKTEDKTRKKEEAAFEVARRTLILLIVLITSFFFPTLKNLIKNKTLNYFGL